MNTFATRGRDGAIAVLASLLTMVLTGCGGGSGDDFSGGGTGPTGNFQQRTETVVTNEAYTPAEVSTDADGKEIIRTRLIVLLSSAATNEEVDDFLTRYNASITSTVAGSRSMAIRIPDPVTIDALNDLIALMEGEAFVDDVLKEFLWLPNVLPSNIAEGEESDYIAIRHQLAIGAAAAWNAKEAITTEPNVLLLDFFGDGSSQLTSYLDVILSGSVASGLSPNSDHGYHVAGILLGRFGGGNMSPDLVTGVIPGRAKLYARDMLSSLSQSDLEASLFQAASSMPGTVILNTSLGDGCATPVDVNPTLCNNRFISDARALVWLNKVRGAGLEPKLLHVTSAGNRTNWGGDVAGYALRDAETSSDYNAAALSLTLNDNGEPVDPLTNTLVVENLMINESDIFAVTPAKILCLYQNSFVGGHIGAVGRRVNSLTTTGTASFTGTSMAAPQVAGLAAYLLAIQPDLSPQQVIDILLDTSEFPGTTGSADCSDFLTPAPAIDAYAAVLALDNASALTGSASAASVRLAILDVADGSGNEGSNGVFDQKDLEYFIAKIDAGTAELDNGLENVRHSRTDLNGDGFDGGGGKTKKFNLDIDYPPTYTTVTRVIEGEEIAFNEASVTDNEILCYYAYSDLYTGSDEQRRTLVAPRCRRGVMAVYVRYLRRQIAVPAGGISSSCPQTLAELEEERETFTTRPMQQIFPPALFDTRLASQYWSPGDVDAEINIRPVSGTRRYHTGFSGNNEPICVDVPFATATEFNATLEHDLNGNRLNVDVISRAEAECKPNPSNLEGDLVCSESFLQTGWQAEFDYAIQTSLNLQLVMQLECSATSDRVVADPNVPNPESLGDMTVFYSTSRYDSSGERVSTIPAEFFACPESGVVDIQKDISVLAPAVPGTTENIVIRVSGSQQIFAPFISDVPTAEGATSISNRMSGYVEVLPGG